MKGAVGFVGAAHPVAVIDVGTRPAGPNLSLFIDAQQQVGAIQGNQRRRFELVRGTTNEVRYLSR